MQEMPFLGLILVFCGLTQANVKRKEGLCPDEERELLLTEKAYQILQSLSDSTTTEVRIVQRARMILMAFDRKCNSEIAQALGFERHCVGRWRRRWQASVQALLAIEMNEPRAAFERAIEDVLRDAPRSGAPVTFDAQQIAQIVSTACESPRVSERPVETWTGRELADEVVKRDIVTSISKSRVNDFLRLVDLQPSRNKGWCFTTEKDHEFFQSQVEQICSTYLNAESAYRLYNTRTICVDEMTSLAANERRSPTRLALPGQPGQIECQYTRHGTLSLTGSWDVVAGQMIHTTIDETRDGEDFARHIRQTIATDPSANWIFVADNLNTHYGEPIVRTVAELLGIDQTDLGDKRKRVGILGCAQSRRQFLIDPDHRIRFVYTPKHSSWLNQIEVVFGVINRRVIRGGSFSSKDDLREKLVAFVNYYNRTYAMPFNWTYTGRPIQTPSTKRPRLWREVGKATRKKQILALVA